MMIPNLHPDVKKLTFVILSFEGPDPYAMVGGLSTRVSSLSETLAEMGFETHLIFIGDPEKPGHQSLHEGSLYLHRWAQWISKYHPGGVYDGEEGKLWDYKNTVPDFVLNAIVRPSVAEGKRIVVMAEDWQTAEPLINLSDRIWEAGLLDHVQLLWNANHTMGFHRIDWGRLDYVATITTVSRYMKHLMWSLNVNPLVIPNGIPAHLLEPVDPVEIENVRSVMEAEIMLVKMARFDPDKRWMMTMETLALLKRQGSRVVLLARGGVENHGKEVLRYAQGLGLRVHDVYTDGTCLQDYQLGLRRVGRTDIYNLRFHVPPSFRQILFAAADLVLANSGREPFGLVGLETMAAGGIAVTGSTGEDYVVPFENALVLDTDKPTEIVTYLRQLQEDSEGEQGIRFAARETAKRFAWEVVVTTLLKKIAFLYTN